MIGQGFVIRRVVIRGKVQGVGYRAWVERLAATHDLKGWVRNRGDGTVEAVLAGPAEQVATMIAVCRQGPRTARVERVDDEAADQAALDRRRPGERFSVLPTM